MKKTKRLNIPVSLFGSVMGLSSISIAYVQFSIYHPSFSKLVTLLNALTIIIFILLLIGYLGKVILHYEDVKKEFNNPFTKSLFSTINISLLLIPIIIDNYHHITAYFIWLIGTLSTLCFTLYYFYYWINTKHSKKEVTPSWILPVTGVLSIPLASYLFPEHYYIKYINVIAISIGLFLTIPIVTLIFTRVIFIKNLSHQLKPTLMVLTTPFSIGYLAYVISTEYFNLFTLSLFLIAIFLFLSLSPILFQIRKICPLQISWWAICFPIACLINSMFSISLHLDSILFFNVASAILLSFSCFIFYLIFRTAKGLITPDVYSLV